MCLQPRRIQKQLCHGSSLRGSSIQQVLLKASHQHLNPHSPARLLQCRSLTPPSGSAFQHCFTSLGRSLGCPQTNPEGASWVFAAWCCRSRPRTQGWNARSLTGREGAKELTHHSSSSSWWQDRANHWLCKLLGWLQGDPPQLMSQAAQWWGWTPRLQEPWIRRAYFSFLYLNYIFSSGNRLQGEDILTLSYESYSVVQNPEFKVSGQEERLHITL